jgi:hypothetical protein
MAVVKVAGKTEDITVLWDVKMEVVHEATLRMSEDKSSYLPS